MYLLRALRRYTGKKHSGGGKNCKKRRRTEYELAADWNTQKRRKLLTFKVHERKFKIYNIIFSIFSKKYVEPFFRPPGKKTVTISTTMTKATPMCTYLRVTLKIEISLFWIFAVPILVITSQTKCARPFLVSFFFFWNFSSLLEPPHRYGYKSRTSKSGSVHSRSLSAFSKK